MAESRALTQGAGFLLRETGVKTSRVRHSKAEHYETEGGFRDSGAAARRGANPLTAA